MNCPYIIRPVQPGDAAAFLALCRQLDAETRFMMLEPGERTTTPATMEARIRALPANHAILVAEAAGELVGYVGAEGGAYRRCQHTAMVVIGIVQAYTGQGLGTRLFGALDAWAREHGIHRLELTVMAHNAAGIALYRKAGFAVEGTKTHSLRVGDRYVDELYMGKLLE